MKKIEIKSHFMDWHAVPAAQAIKFIMVLKSSITGITTSEINEYINTRYLRGITVEELLK